MKEGGIEIQICPLKVSSTFFATEVVQLQKQFMIHHHFAFFQTTQAVRRVTEEEERNSWQPPDVCPSVYRRSEDFIRNLTFSLWIYNLKHIFFCERSCVKLTLITQEESEEADSNNFLDINFPRWAEFSYRHPMREKYDANLRM